MRSKIKQRRLPVIMFLSVIFSISLVTGASPSWAVVVNSPADGGPGSLREAIMLANGDGVPTIITFDPAVFPAVIALTSQLPPLLGPGDTIDGTGNGVVLDGSLMGGLEIGLRLRASNLTVRGLTIQNFPRDGVRIEPGISGIGTGVIFTRNTVQGNREDGLRVTGREGPDNLVSATISNNVFNRNLDDGIFVQGSYGDTGNGRNTVEVVINNNEIRGSQGVQTGGTQTGDGIRVVGAGGSGSRNNITASITNNIVRENVDDGILVAGAGGDGAASNNVIHAEIVGNRVIRSGEAASTRGIGIGVRGGNRSDVAVAGNENKVTFVIINNESRRSKDRGINVSGGWGSLHTVSGTVAGNKVDRSGVTGIHVVGGGALSSGNTLEDINVLDNKISRSGEDGIQVTGGSGENCVLADITLKGNEARRNGRDGIRVSPGSGIGNLVSVTGITDNETHRNDKDGISVKAGVSGSGAVPISANQAHRNQEDGIDLDDTGYLVIANQADRNAGDGINAVGNIDGGGNTAVGNAGCNTPGCF